MVSERGKKDKLIEQKSCWRAVKSRRLIDVMTLGLATADAKNIYLAIESQGLSDHFPLNSKLIDIQFDPEITILIAGGLDHWYYVVKNYSKQQILVKAVAEIKRLLDDCMNRSNQAYGLVCGFEDRSPRCFRINRFVNEGKSTSDEENLIHKIQPLGSEKHIKAACCCATDAVSKGVSKLTALVNSIESRLPGSDDISPPIHKRVMRLAKPVTPY